MSLRSVLKVAVQATAASLVCAAAHAGYLQWETVELPASSGASCGNGTPYRFFVNRTPFTSKTVVMFEGGGACWDQGACKGGTLLDAVNPDGIPTNYMTDWNRQAHLGLVPPFTMRLHPLRPMLLCLVLLAASSHAMANESRQAPADDACPDSAASTTERTDDGQGDETVAPARQAQKAKPAVSASPRATGGTRTNPPRFHSFLPGMFR